MKRGFYTIMSAQFFSSLADNALFIGAVALLKSSGDSVRRGEAIAQVGNSGGQPQAGLYFEIRWQGKPVNPASWLGR